MISNNEVDNLFIDNSKVSVREVYSTLFEDWTCATKCVAHNIKANNIHTVCMNSSGQCHQIRL